VTTVAHVNLSKLMTTFYQQLNTQDNVQWPTGKINQPLCCTNALIHCSLPTPTDHLKLKYSTSTQVSSPPVGWPFHGYTVLALTKPFRPTQLGQPSMKSLDKWKWIPVN